MLLSNNQKLVSLDIIKLNHWLNARKITLAIINRSSRITTDLEGNTVKNAREFFDKSNQNNDDRQNTNKNEENEALYKSGNNTLSKKAVLITDGVKHTIPLEDIQSGGPPKDGIPAIDNPSPVNILLFV